MNRIVFHLSNLFRLHTESSRWRLGVERFRPPSSSLGIGPSFRVLRPKRIAHIGSANPLHR
jgi:hypothetical protein